jgi:hypothetical protein
MISLSVFAITFSGPRSDFGMSVVDSGIPFEGLRAGFRCAQNDKKGLFLHNK